MGKEGLVRTYVLPADAMTLSPDQRKQVLIKAAREAVMPFEPVLTARYGSRVPVSGRCRFWQIPSCPVKLNESTPSATSG
ncbi:hypothetical protein HYW42_01405 [Candidatus Daviesbacteria bacterium]|nr:hypothetical protein [Candidatus Daviesbacteria bacterium]